MGDGAAQKTNTQANQKEADSQEGEPSGTLGKGWNSLPLAWILLPACTCTRYGVLRVDSCAVQVAARHANKAPTKRKPTKRRPTKKRPTKKRPTAKRPTARGKRLLLAADDRQQVQHQQQRQGSGGSSSGSIGSAVRDGLVHGISITAL